MRVKPPAPEERTIVDTTVPGASAPLPVEQTTLRDKDPHSSAALDHTPAEPTMTSAVNAADLPRGATIGRYLVLDRLGAGGMGVVYAAYDPELDRKVAIKLLHTVPGSAGDAQGRTRLLREAQAMARLAHPNVISVFDVGTAFEQVFVAMEFIDGGTLSGWLKQKPRSQEEILSLFTLAGRGLAAAHAADLVHRDFKPDNVLVGKDGSVRVTDFGLARNVDPQAETPDPESGGRNPALRQSGAKARLAALGIPPSLHVLSNQPLSTPLTQAGALMGTPRYMAPEQFRCRPTDQRTDEFSFCIALYEALYEATPFAGSSVGDRCYNVMVGNIQPPPPDKSVPSWLRKALLRGLSVAPEDRYPTMTALLAELSLDARRTRRRWLTGALALAGLAVVLSLALTYQRARNQLAEYRCRNAAERLKDAWDPQRKQAIRTALLSSKKSYAQDTLQRIEQNLQEYMDRWQTLRDQQCHDTFVSHKQTPVLLERSLRCLDRRLQEVGAFTDLLLKADERVLTQAEEISGSFTTLDYCEDRLYLGSLLPEKPEQWKQIDDLNRRMAVIRLVGRVGRYVEQREMARKMLVDAQSVGYEPVAAAALSLLGESESNNRNYASAEQHYFAALILSIQGGDRQSAVERLLDLMRLAGTKLKQPQHAIQWQQLAAAELRDVVSSDRIKLLLKQRLLLNACQIDYTIQPPQLDRAEEECQQALALQKQLYHTTNLGEWVILNSLALTYERQHKFDKALALYQQILAFFEKSRGSYHPLVARELYSIGQIFKEQEKYKEAAEYLERSLQIEKQAMGENHPRLYNTLVSLVTVATLQKQFAAASSYAQYAFKIKRSEVGTDEDAKLAPVYNLLGQVKYKQGHYAEALREHRHALDICEKQHCDFAEYLVAVADDLRGLGQSKQAVPMLEQALRLQQSAANPLEVARSQFSLAQALWAVDKRRNRQPAQAAADNARQLYEKAGSPSAGDLEAVTAWLAKNKLD